MSFRALMALPLFCALCKTFSRHNIIKIIKMFHPRLTFIVWTKVPTGLVSTWVIGF